MDLLCLRWGQELLKQELLASVFAVLAGQMTSAQRNTKTGTILKDNVQKLKEEKESPLSFNFNVEYKF